MTDSVYAYIAGFLDGDGSIMLQIKPREDVRFGFRITSTICFYQDSSQEDELLWIRDQLGVGYVYKRNDGISELRVNGHQRVAETLRRLKPYIHFKRNQVDMMLEALEKLEAAQTPENFLEVCALADEIASKNYASRRKNTAAVVRKEFETKGWLVPVTTESFIEG